jgi:hypothetical protein
MAFATRVTRIANPRGGKARRTYRRTRANASPKAPVKRRRRHNRTKARAKVYRTKAGRFTRRKPNTGRPRTRRTKAVRRRAANTTRRNRTYRRRAKRSNPVLLEFGALNPFRGGTTKRRKKSVARKRKYRRSSNPSRRAKARRVYHRRRSTNRRSNYRRRRRNPVAVMPVRRRRRSYRRSRSRNRRRMNSHRRRRHNPSLFGKSGMKDMLLMIGGGLVGVAATKYLPTLIPTSMLTSLGSSSLVSVAITGAGAFVAGWLAGKISKEFGEAVLFGGLMQTGSALLNAFAPASVSGALALSGVGDIVPTGMFPVPNNQFRSYVPPAPPSAANGSKGVGAFRGAFGYRR